MGTRANVIIKDEYDEIIFYRHSGGYPEEWNITKEDGEKLQQVIEAVVDSLLPKCPLWRPVGEATELQFKFTGDEGEIETLSN